MDIPLVFEQTEFSIHVPHVPGDLDPPSDQAERETWVQDLVKSQGERETCFYGERCRCIGKGARSIELADLCFCPGMPTDR